MEKETPSYYAILTAKVRYDKKLSFAEKVLFAEITALCNMSGECFASNNYFASLYNVTPQAISKWINNIKKEGHLVIEYKYKKGTKEIEKRIIKTVDMVSTNIDTVSTMVEKVSTIIETYQQPIKDNITLINTNIINKESAPPKKSISSIEKSKNVLKLEVQNLKAQFSNTDQEKQYFDLVNFILGKNNLGLELSAVLKIENQITFKQFETLNKAGLDLGSICQMLYSFENTPKYQDKKSLYLTFLNWNKRDNKRKTA